MKRGIAEVGPEEAGRKREHRVAEPYSTWRAPSPLATRSFVSEELGLEQMPFPCANPLHGVLTIEGSCILILGQ